jgi:O-antigen ligase
MTHHLRLGLAPAYLLLCLLLGGASAAGYWANMTLQLLAVPILFWAAIARRSAPMSTPGRQLMALLGLTIALIALQLVPLPPSLWTALPGREAAVEGFRMLGEPLPWLPLSLAPDRTLASALWLLPSIAVLLAILRLGTFRSAWLAWAIAIVTIVSVGIGALQIVGGEGSPWYLYTITNWGVTTGFFANANHMATLLVATVPFLAALYVTARAQGRSVKRASGMFVVLAGTLTIVFVGLAANRSIAGLGLAVPVFAGSFLMILSRKRRLPRWSVAVVALLIAGSVAAAFSAPFGNNLTTQAARTTEESRYTSFTRTIDAAGDYMPVGSGIGTFGEIYPTRENPANITRFYMNHVHGDYIELALETGVPGLLLILLFLLWWGRRAVAVWRAEEPDYYARAATIASAAILAHSLVDYPLRTAAIGAIFAMCCALMAESRARVKKSARAADPAKQARHLSAD